MLTNCYHLRTNQHAHLLQTETCKSWQAFRKCRFGNRCQFAHGHEEVCLEAPSAWSICWLPPHLLAALQIRPLIRHPKYKTEASTKPCWALHYWPVHTLQDVHATLWLHCSSADQLHVVSPASMETGGRAIWGSARRVCACPDPSNCLHLCRRCKFIHPHDLPAMAGASPAGAANTAAPSAQLPGLASSDGSAAAVTAGPDRSVLCFVRDSPGHWPSG